MHRVRLALLVAVAAFLVASVSTELGVPTGDIVATIAQIESWLEANSTGTAYVSETITLDVDPAGASVEIANITLPDAFDYTLECAPGAEIRINNTDADYDTSNDVELFDVVVPATIEEWVGRPHRLTLKNCYVPEYKLGVVGSTNCGVGRLDMFLINGTNNVDAAKSIEIVLDNTQLVPCSPGSETLGPAAGAVKITMQNGSYATGFAALLLKANCNGDTTDCDGILATIDSSIVEALDVGRCDDDGNNPGVACTPGGAECDGTCVDVGVPDARVLKQIDDQKIEIRNHSELTGTLHFSSDGAEGNHIHTIEDSILHGPGAQSAEQAVLFMQTEETIRLDNLGIGTEFDTVGNSEFLYIRAGSVTGNGYFMGTSELWKTGGAYFSNVLVHAAALGGVDIGDVELTFTGPTGAGPGAILSPDAYAAFASEAVSGWVCAGDEYGCVYFYEGAIVAPPGTVYEQACDDVLLGICIGGADNGDACDCDDDDSGDCPSPAIDACATGGECVAAASVGGADRDLYIQLGADAVDPACTTYADEGDADDQTLAPVAGDFDGDDTKILGCIVTVSKGSGANAQHDFTLRAGPAGTLIDLSMTKEMVFNHLTTPLAGGDLATADQVVVLYEPLNIDSAADVPGSAGVRCWWNKAPE